MPTPNHIETIKQLNDTLNAGSAINDLQSLRKTIEAMFKEGNPDIRTELAQLRKNIEPVLAGQVTNTARESWVKIANDLDRNYALIYSPEEGIGSISRYVNAAVNRVMQLGRENVSVLGNASPQTQNLVRTGVLAVGALAAGAVLYAGMKALWSAIRHPIITLTAVTGAIGSYIVLGNTLRGLPDSVRSYFPGWLNWIAGTTAPTTQPNQKQTAEQMKTLEDQRQKQEGITNGILSDLQATPVDENARRSLVAIQTEIGQIESIPSGQRQEPLVRRLKFLNDERQRIEKLISPDEVKKLADERKKQAEDEVKAAEEKAKNDAAKRAKETKEAIAKLTPLTEGALGGLPENTNLFSPQHTLTIDGIPVRLGPDGMYIRNRKMNLWAFEMSDNETREPSAIPDNEFWSTAMNSAVRRGNSLRVDTSVYLGFVSVARRRDVPNGRPNQQNAVVFTLSNIAEALAHFRNTSDMHTQVIQFPDPTAAGAIKRVAVRSFLSPER